MVNEELIRHLAELSKIGFTEDELSEMTEDMKNIIALMDKVREFDTTLSPYAQDAVYFSDLRADEIMKSLSTAKVTENVKTVKDDCFVVPKVV